MSEIKVNSIRHNSDTEIVQFKGGVGVGTNTTAIRDAGISTATGSLHYNLTTSKLEFYDGSEWKAIKTQHYQGGLYPIRKQKNGTKKN